MSMPLTGLRLRFYGDAALRNRSRPVDVVTDKERQVISEMAHIMRLAAGVGLAAPQVGVNQQIIVVDVGQGPVVLINPRITKKRGAQSMEEGCLSLPGIYVSVKRARRIQVTGLNDQNEKVSIVASDLLARALQHEIDHLRGRLIIDHANLLQRIKLRKKLKSLKVQEAAA
jgi:peptide deformylase